MNQALLNSLTDEERRFVASTSRRALARLDEEQTLDLHERARRMRDKYVSTYRRSGAAAVRDRGSRGTAYAENQRDRAKAEVFEAALSDVSRRLGALAEESAARLRAERIEAARGEAVAGPDASLLEPAVRTSLVERVTHRPLRSVHRAASLRSEAARFQRRRDSRGLSVVRDQGPARRRASRNRPVRQP